MKICAVYTLLGFVIQLTGVAAKLVKSDLRPIRGWTSWDLSALKNNPPYGPQWLNETNVLRQSAALFSSGLQTRGGLDHINIDAFWSFNPNEVVDDFGRWQTNTTRFPSGMTALSKAVHARGQKVTLLYTV